VERTADVGGAEGGPRPARRLHRHPESLAEAPLDAYVIAEAPRLRACRRGVLNVVTADRDVSERMVRNPGVDRSASPGRAPPARRSP